MAGVVASIAVEPTLQLRLEAAAARGDSRGTDNLMHAAARLIARMPRSCPAELNPGHFQQLWFNMAYLLGHVCSLLGRITQPLMAAEALPCGQLEQQQQRPEACCLRSMALHQACRLCWPAIQSKLR